MRLCLRPLIGQSVPTLVRSVFRPRRWTMQVHGLFVTLYPHIAVGESLQISITLFFPWMNYPEPQPLASFKLLLPIKHDLHLSSVLSFVCDAVHFHPQVLVCLLTPRTLPGKFETDACCFPWFTGSNSQIASSELSLFCCLSLKHASHILGCRKPSLNYDLIAVGFIIKCKSRR